MAEKMINTRIQLKYDSFANWTDKNPLLKSGEVAIAYLAESHTSTTPDNSTHPVMFKVGPGNFNSLPWASALAADVHAWAKKSEDDFKTWVKGLVDVSDIDLSAYYNKTEVDGLLSTNSTNDQKYTDDAIAALNVTDTAVTGKYVSAVSEEGGKINVVRADLPTYTLASGTANGTVAFNGSDVAVTGLGSAAYTDAKAYDAAGAADAVNSALESYKTTNDAAVSAATTKGQQGIDDAAAALAKANEKTTMAEVEGKNYATKTEAQAMADGKDAAIKAAKDAADSANAKIDAFMSNEAAVEGAIDTLVEINKYITEDTNAFTQLSASVEDVIDGTTPVAKATNADKAADADKLGGANASDYLKKADATGYADILTKTDAAGLYQAKGNYATAEQGAKADTAVQPAALDNYYTKAIADATFMDSNETSNAIDAKITALNLATTYEPIGAETRANAYADGLASNYATAAQGAKADSALQSITTTANGGLKITGTNQVDIDTDVIFVFNCGSASEVF